MSKDKKPDKHDYLVGFIKMIGIIVAMVVIFILVKVYQVGARDGGGSGLGLFFVAIALAIIGVVVYEILKWLNGGELNMRDSDGGKGIFSWLETLRQERREDRRQATADAQELKVLDRQLEERQVTATLLALIAQNAAQTQKLSEILGNIVLQRERLQAEDTIDVRSDQFNRAKAYADFTTENRRIDNDLMRIAAQINKDQHERPATPQEIIDVVELVQRSMQDFENRKNPDKSNMYSAETIRRMQDQIQKLLDKRYQ